MFNKIYGLIVIFCIHVALFSSSAMAGFLQMPEITEAPELEKKSLLEDLSVHSVRDRDPDPESGPRLNIKKFKLEGIVEYPELGITKKDIEDLIENIRADLMQDYKVQESGFTAKEIEDVTKLLVEIEEKTVDRHVTELELQKLIWLVREQRSNRGITLGTIETVADRITKFYRERGFILAKAYIPKQEVRDGIVTLTLLLGILGEVSVSGNELYDSKYLSSVFDNMMTKPVTSSVTEENLYLINDFPGMTATGFFQPGSQVGDTKININVKSEKPYEANFRLDNHGSEQTGEYRFYTQGLVNNIAGNADQIEFSALLTAKPENTIYGQVRYSSRLFSPRFNLSAGVANNDFILGSVNNLVDELGMEGSTKQMDVTATYRIKRSRAKNYYMDLKYEEIKSEIRIGALPDEGDFGLDDIINNITLSFRFDVLDEDRKILHQGDFNLTSGAFDKGAEIGQDDQYEIVNINYSLLTFWSVPYFETNTRVIYRTSIQYASSALSTISQFSLAGPTRARAYPINQFSADNAIYMGVDWIFDSLQMLDFSIGQINLKNSLHPFIFLDVAKGDSISLVDSEADSSGELIDAGVGIQFANSNNFKANLQLGFPLKEKFSSEDTTTPDDKFKIIFDIQYNFL